MIIIRQKEYGLRDKVANWLSKSIEKDREAANKSHTKAIMERRKIDVNDDIQTVRRLRSAGKARRTLVKQNIDNSVHDNINISFKGKSGYFRNRIEYKPDFGSSGLAHEIGHTIEREEGSKFGKLIDKLSDRARTDQRKTMNSDEKGIITSAKRFIQGKLINENEKRASKRGIELLKKVKADNELINHSKEALDGSFGTYKHIAKINYKTPLYNLIKSKKKGGNNV